ncbi:hypothetical protein BC830DRAFT_1148647 [Chytriomyces sp. MP71]|nr:hypothetical protein BC830DRAFT_1148647 [Chytriomyces sp. MP71]
MRHHLSQTYMEVAMKNNTTGVESLDLLRPDGTIASVAQIPVVERPWQSAAPPHKTMLRQKFKTAGKGRRARISELQKQREQKHEIKPWTTATDGLIVTKEQLNMNMETRSALRCEPEPFNPRTPAARITLTPASMVPPILGSTPPLSRFVTLTVEGVRTTPYSRKMSQPDCATVTDEIIKTPHTEIEKPTKGLLDKKRTGLNLPMLELNEAETIKELFKPIQRELLPKINPIPKPVSLFNVDAVVSPKVTSSLISDSQMKRQMWCHDYNSASETLVPTKDVFVRISLPKGLKPQPLSSLPLPKSPLSKPNSSIQIIREMLKEAHLKKLPSNQDEEFITSAKNDSSVPSLKHLAFVKPPSLPNIHALHALSRKRDGARPQPPIPKKMGKSIEEIMADMNSALNNLFFYPSVHLDSGKQKSTTFCVNDTNKSGTRRHSKKLRYIPPEHDSQSLSKHGKLLNRARTDYNYFHLKKEDYFEPLCTQKIEVAQCSLPELPLGSQAFLCVAGLFNEDPGQEPKHRVMKQKPKDQPHLRVKSKFVDQLLLVSSHESVKATKPHLIPSEKF